MLFVTFSPEADTLTQIDFLYTTLTGKLKEFIMCILYKMCIRMIQFCIKLFRFLFGHKLLHTYFYKRDPWQKSRIQSALSSFLLMPLQRSNSICDPLWSTLL